MVDGQGRVLAKCPQCERGYCFNEHALSLMDVKEQALAQLANTEAQLAVLAVRERLMQLLNELEQLTKALKEAISYTNVSISEMESGS